MFGAIVALWAIKRCDSADCGWADVEHGYALCLQTPVGEMDLELALRGEFQFYNAAAAVSAGLALGIDPPLIADALPRFACRGGLKALIAVRILAYLSIMPTRQMA